MRSVFGATPHSFCRGAPAVFPSPAPPPPQTVSCDPGENTRHSPAHPCTMCRFNRRPIMPRMNILNTVEREAFESPPVFNSVQRKQYFDFPTELRRLAGELRAPAHQLGFLLSAGYFKAAKSFFPPSAFHRRDPQQLSPHLEPLR